jgi:thymidylate synthase ThyX
MAKIFIYEEFAPQDNAMMQALYSRSPQSVIEHVKKVKQTGSGKFMETFYVGYGHASIADCGSTTIFIEGISILGDKAVQDWPLYSGQETSTRYVDMTKQQIVDPVGSSESKVILKRWMDFYIFGQAKMEETLKQKYPRKKNEEEGVYNKAIKARAFDIMRGFLPAGITTQLSWHTNLRQAYDKLVALRHHPLPEVKKIAQDIFKKLKEKYPHSFSQSEVLEQENYREKCAQKYNYFKSSKPVNFFLQTNISRRELEKYQNIIKGRPAKTGFPHFLTELGVITFEFLLDFGSFRDLQRHRNGVCRMPLLTIDLGFNDWYLEQLSDALRAKAQKLIVRQKRAIAKLKVPAEIKQYYIALGFNVVCRVTYGLPAAVYVVELRSGKMVHPTLRQIALKMRKALLAKFPKLVLNCDLEPAVWDISRGLQDIVKK